MHLAACGSYKTPSCRKMQPLTHFYLLTKAFVGRSVDNGWLQVCRRTCGDAETSLLHARQGCREITRKAVAAQNSGGMVLVHDFILADTLDRPLFSRHCLPSTCCWQPSRVRLIPAGRSKTCCSGPGSASSAASRLIPPTVPGSLQARSIDRRTTLTGSELSSKVEGNRRELLKYQDYIDRHRSFDYRSCMQLHDARLF